MNIAWDAEAVATSSRRGGDSNRKAGKNDTPAKRSKRRKVPATELPPEPPTGDRRSTLRNLHVRIAGRSYLVGPSIVGDPPTTASWDAAATVTLTIRDPDETLLQALGDEAEMLERGVTCQINGVTYQLQSGGSEGDGQIQLVFEDQVKTRLEQFDRFISMRRTTTVTFFRFAKRLVDEAQQLPYAPLRSFIPELRDRRRVEQPARTKGSAGRSRGTGSDTSYTVKRKAATSRQRGVIDGILTEADRLGGSERFMVACIMAATQESRMGEETGRTGNDDLGIYHQGRNWISESGAKDPKLATRAFALGGSAFGRSAPGWKDIHGSLKTVPGGYESAIKRVQVSVGGYSQWQSEAEKTVKAWLGKNGGGGSRTRTKVEPYEFTRGERGGEREDSWACLGRYASDRMAHRWAWGNVLHVVSEEELRAAAPSMEVHGDEEWLVSPPKWEWGVGRPYAELRMSVLTERWGMQIGACVLVATGDPRRGRYIVAETNGTLVGPVTEVVLRRPVVLRPEPPNQTSTTTVGGGSGTDSSRSANSALEAARAISRRGLPYVWGGGHRSAGTPDRGTGRDPGIGYDCSGAVGAFLAMLGHGFRRGQSVPASSGFASWGRSGKGRTYTVWYNSTHMWVEFPDGSRLDTSPYGEGGPGARYRRKRRPTTGFSPRHWPGN